MDTFWETVADLLKLLAKVLALLVLVRLLFFLVGARVYFPFIDEALNGLFNLFGL
jgi:hypothetical protein